ncbi:hypothetical protein C440_11173 [Haloferax mucosum ATCC BAA-1512]|uniref:Glycine zipper-like domain-containing protein n=1 Tax=Haloferax mucosum ATCC BAA-1512 TaxID=662479 RepID=M0IE96_9EURY|nr:hypothetical protein [Haloferax mucosum]ELZ94178.1 hypothetical protein C440_11173 [Haloferax mucosum ATCC BAA-1512]
MSQKSVSLSAESFQQPQPDVVEREMVDSDDHEGSSHSAEQFGIGLSAGFLIGGILGVLTNSLSLGVMFGMTVGVVLGVVLMEYR